MAVTSMTWKDIKLATLQKMFAAEGSTIPSDGSTEDYIAAMPYVANEGIQRLVTVGKPIANGYTIAHYPQENLLGDTVGMTITPVQSGTKEFVAKGAKAAYFQFAGVGQLDIYINDTLDANSPYTLDSIGTYSTSRYLIGATADDVVTLRFTITSPGAIKNIALYGGDYSSTEDIPEYAARVMYDLRKIEGFYRLYNDEIYIDDGTMHNKLPQAFYRFDAGRALYLDRNKPGSYIIFFQSYPEKIDAATDDDYVLPLDPEVVVLLPLYMASQLYKDDDNGIATAYRNEFEVALEGLQQYDYEEGHEAFTSKGGWV